MRFTFLTVLLLFYVFLGAPALGRAFETVFELGHSHHVTSLDFHPTKKILASGGRDFTVKIWDLDNWALKRALPNHGGTVLMVRFSPDGQYLLTGDRGNVIQWDFENGTKIHTYQLGCSYIAQLKFIDATRFISGCIGDMNVWDLANKTKEYSFGIVTPGWVTRYLDTSVDGRWVAYTNSKMVEVYDLVNRRFVRRLDVEKNPVSYLGFLGDHLVLFHRDQSVSVREISNFNEVEQFKLDERLNRIQIDKSKQIIRIFSTTTISHLSMGGEGAQLNVYDNPSPHQAALAATAYSQPLDIVATGGYDNKIKLFNFTEGYHHLGSLGEQIPEVSQVLFSDNDLIVGDSLGGVSRIQLQRGRSEQLVQRVKGISDLKQSGDMLGVASGESKALVYDLKNGKTLFEVEESNKRIGKVGFTPDAKHFVTATNQISFWKSENGSKAFSLQEDIAHINGFSFNETGVQLVTTNSVSNKSVTGIYLWDRQSGKIKQHFKGHSRSVSRSVFSSDGNYIYSASHDNHLIQWDATTAKKIKRFVDPNLITAAGNTHEYGLFYFELLGGSNRVVTAGFQDGYLKLWDTVSGNLLARTTIPRMIKGLKVFAHDDSTFSLYIMTRNGEIKHILKWDPQDSNGLQTIHLQSPIRTGVNTTSAFDIWGETSALVVGTESGELVKRSFPEPGSIQRIKAFNDYVSRTAFLGSDKLIAASALNSSEIVVWNLVNGQTKKIDTGHEGRIVQLAYMQNTGELFTSGADGRVKKIALNGTVSELYTHPSGGIYAVTAHPSKPNHYLLSGGGRLNRNQVKAWTIKPNGAPTAIGGGTYRGSQVSYHEKQRFFAWNDGQQFSYFRLLPSGSGAGYDKHFFTKHTASSRNNEFMPNGQYYWGTKLNSMGQYSLSGSLAKRFTGLSGTITDYSWSEKLNLLGAATREGWIYLWRHDKPDQYLKVFSQNGHTLIMDSQGYYFGSKYLLNKLKFKLSDKIYAFEQFDLIKNRPDIILSQLPFVDDKTITLYRTAYQQRLKQNQLHSLQANELQLEEAPEVVITNKDKLPLATEKSYLELALKLSTKTGSLSNLFVTVNGSTMGHHERGILLDSEVTQHKKLHVPLSDGPNRIRISVRNNSGIESARESLLVNYIGPKVESALYVVAAGVSQYASEADQLVYPAKDARAIGNAFGDDPKVKTLVLTDQQVSKANIQDIKDFLEPMKVNDRLLVFLSGHGVVDEGVYYFVPPDANADNVTVKGIPYSSLVDLLSTVDSRNKLMIINTCYSGEFSDAKTLEELEAFNLSTSIYTKLYRSSGATVVATAEGRSTSKEIVGSNKKQGLIASVIVNAVEQGKQLRVSELIDNLVKTSKKKGLFSRQQNKIPKVREVNLNNDFWLID
ncbi:exported hypothetical protein [Vibrio coralliirubri]|uniref:caspase family protein n=1 Tax=Vibrio coralliirubri TaxID=1516159 RepID=UPI00063035A0|nr:caspase family protein [Vibrio coralliirubri]CDT84157.1 exported hypothetical protein [Vibrio coralliirubri]